MIDLQKHNNEIFKKIYEENKDSIIELPIEQIHLIEKAHLNSEKTENVTSNFLRIVHAIRLQNGKPNGILIVRPFNGNYVLVSGYKWYKVAKKLHSNIRCIVIDEDMTSYKFNQKYRIVETYMKQPEPTQNYIHYSKLRISNKIKEPNQEKMLNKFKEFDDNKGLLKPITVKRRKDGTYIMVDGYLGYLYLKQNKERWIPIVYIGKNTNKPNKKVERVK